MSEQRFCHFCNSSSKVEEFQSRIEFYNCPVCGKYIIDSSKSYDEPIMHWKKYLSSFFLYNKLPDNSYYVLCDEDVTKTFNNVFENKNIVQITETLLTETINLSFAQKIDKLLIYLADKCECVGVEKDIPEQEFYSAAFISCYDKKGNCYYNNEVIQQFNCLVKFLEDVKKYIVFNPPLFHSKEHMLNVSLTPVAWERIDSLQKAKTNNKSVFVAMSFDESCKSVRNAIKKGIEKSGYIPILIDEVKHNHQIMPELFRYIRESKFLVLDISKQNYGAYYEAGYAQGLGKEVIICCSRDRFNDKEDPPHFDVRQKQMLVYENVEILSDMLKEWIWGLFEKSL